MLGSLLRRGIKPCFRPTGTHLLVNSRLLFPVNAIGLRYKSDVSSEINKFSEKISPVLPTESAEVTAQGVQGVQGVQDAQSIETIQSIQNITPDSVATMDHIQTIAESVPISPDQIGYFESVGLAESWISPSGFFQHIFEYVNVYTGMPWWGTILTVTIATRLLMLPLYIASSDTSAKMTRIKPELTDLLERTKNTSDPIEMQKVVLERRNLMKENKIKILDMGKPLLSVPIFIGYFNALRGMSNVPVSGFTSEGMAWFTNLAAPDPFCGLQILTAAFYAATFRYFGGETGAATVSPVMQKVFTYMPFIAVPLTMPLPASVCFYFSINAVFAVLQSLMLNSAKVRAILGMSKMVTPEEQAVINQRLGTSASGDDSVISALRKKYQDARDNAEKRMRDEQIKKMKDDEYKMVKQNEYIQIRDKSQNK
mgnify:FL=1